MTVNIMDSAAQLSCIFVTVINTSHKTVFKSNSPAGLLKIIAACIQDFVHTVPLCNRHKFLSFFIIWCMQRQGKGNLQFFLCKLINFWNNSAGRYGDIPLADVKTIFIGKQMYKAYNMIIIIHRFAGSHYYYIRYPLSRYALDPVNLIQHFRRKKVSCPASNSGSTKTAPHFTAYL